MDAGAWDDQDKQMHAAIGVVAGGASALAVNYLLPELSPLEKRLAALIPVILLAVGKEVYDHQHPDAHTSDWKDAAATVAGGALSIELVLRF